LSFIGSNTIASTTALILSFISVEFNELFSRRDESSLTSGRTPDAGGKNVELYA
jgi:hypothetical protein